MIRLARLSVLLLFAATVWPQGAVTIFGTVTDSSGAVVANASIVVTNTQTGAGRITITDGTG